MSISIRGFAAGTATSGVGDTLSVESQPGDLAVLVYADQWAWPAVVERDGWEYTTTSDAGNRSGYIASLQVTDPVQTQGITGWWANDSSRTSRQRGLLIVLTGVDKATVSAWAAYADPFTGSGDQVLYLGQTHGAAGNLLDEWTAPGQADTARAGEVSTTASWSVLDAKLGTAGNVTLAGDAVAPQAVASISLTQTTETASVPVFTGTSTGSLYSMGVLPSTRCTTAQEFLEVVKSDSETAVIAHAGSDVDWPPMSTLAYSNALTYWPHALELSVHRTSDGVWFGIHDDTLAATSGDATLTTSVREMTWEQVQEHLNGTVPYMRVEEYLNLYGDCVTLLDPKHSAEHFQELLDLGFTPEKTIGKFYASATELAATFKAAGLLTWGYMYGTDQANFPVWAPNWDMAGINYDATTEQWNTMKATGSLIIAHICENTTAVQTALAAGAGGLMVSKIGAALDRVV